MIKTRYEGFLLNAINGYIVLVDYHLPPPPPLILDGIPSHSWGGRRASLDLHEKTLVK